MIVLLLCGLHTPSNVLLIPLDLISHVICNIVIMPEVYIIILLPKLDDLNLVISLYHSHKLSVLWNLCCAKIFLTVNYSLLIINYFDLTETDMVVGFS